MDGDGITDVLDDDRDGDGFPNWEDAYPDDGGKWDEDVEAGGRWLWWIPGIVLALVVGGVVVGAVMVRRRKKREGEDREKDVDGSDEDELGRVGKGGDEEGEDEGGSKQRGGMFGSEE